MPRKHKPPLSDLTVKAKDCFDPTEYMMVHRRYLDNLVSAAADVLVVLDIIDHTDDSQRFARERMLLRSAIGAAREVPQAADAVDPSAADPGTPTPREKEAL